MSVCPKCQKKLRLFDISQNCPHCGINIRFCNFEEKFYNDAKKAELDAANINMMLTKLKASFVGGKLPVIRLISILPAVAVALLPFGNFTLNLPFLEKSFSLNALGIYTMFSDSTLQYILKMSSADVSGVYFSALRNAIITCAIPVLFSVLILLFTLLCFISIKKMPKILCTLSVFGFLGAVAATVFSAVLSSATSNTELINCSMSVWGLLGAIVAYAFVFTVNLLISKKGLALVYKEGTEERVAIYKQIKSGKIKMEDLPQPIVETEETRKIMEEIQAEQDKFKNMQKEEKI